MSAIDGEGSMLDQYFDAWRTLDQSRVGMLFHDDATYEREGKATLWGVDQIEEYWRRNRTRQTDLKVFQHVPMDGTRDACTFCARFVDAEEKQTQTVFGWMTLEVADGKIRRLREGYAVHREPLAEQKPRTWSDLAVGFLRQARWKAVEWGTRLVEWIAAKGSRIVYYLLLLVLGGSAFGVDKLPDAALCALTLNSVACKIDDPALRTTLESDAVPVLIGLAFAAVFLLPTLHKVRHRFLAPVKTIRLVGDGQDLEEMKKRFRGAKQLVVHAGDFDFVGRDPEFRLIFAGLNEAGALELVSDKPMETVRDGFGRTPEAVVLLESLIQRERIRFRDSRRLRCSIVHRWDYPEVLYRYEHGGGEEERHRLRICVLRGRGDVGPVVDLLKRSAGAVT